MFNMRLQFSLAITAMVFTLCACSPGGKEEQVQKTEVVTQMEAQLDPNVPLREEVFSHEFVPGEITKYTAIVSWPKGPVVLRITDRELKREYVFNAQEENRFALPCSDNRLYYQVEMLTPEMVSLSKVVVIKKCPRDVVLEGQVTNLTNLYQADGRIIIKDGTTIVPPYRDLKLKFNSLKVEGIATIKIGEADRTPLNQFDVSSAKINLQGNEASGVLRFELNGQDGLRPSDIGDELNPELNGQPGVDGRIKQSTNCKRIGRLDGGVEICPAPVCERQPGVGDPGHDAVKYYYVLDGKRSPVRIVGRQGNAAYPGVGTPSVILDISDVSNFFVQVEFNPGIASKPGRGGLPKGGRGGAAGFNPGAPCVAAVPGPDGIDGERGPLGEKADDGECGTISVPRALISRVLLKDKNLSCSKKNDIVRPL